MTELKTSPGRLISLPVLALIIAALALLAFQAGDSTRPAVAYPGLTVGIDMDASTTTDTDGDGDYDSVNVATFEDCTAVSNLATFTVDVFVLDVVDLVAYSLDVEYNSSVVNILSVDTNEILGAQVGSLVVDASGGVTGPGTYNAGAFDQSNQGDDGSGVLASFTVQAVASGVSPFNLDLRPSLSRGVTLKDVANVNLGDANADGFFDGPFIPVNAAGNIAVDTLDLDGDTVPDACDSDLDGDGFDNGVDNCPNIYNPTQSDIDGDGKGDPCDTYDADGDGYKNDLETLHGSNTLDAASRPEVCDGVDNDGDTQVDEGRGSPNVPFRDQDGDTVPDCTDGNVDTDGDTIVNTSDTDDDGDGTTDANEHKIITDSLRRCNNGVEYPDWPPDFDNNKVINVTDVFQVLPPVFGTSGENPNYSRRADLVPDGVINVTDVFRVLPPVFGTSCTP
jgi:hypothetical protein